MKVKNPIFMECVRVCTEEDKEKKKLSFVEHNLIENTLKDCEGAVVHWVLGERKGFFSRDTAAAKPLGEAFDMMRGWLDEVYGG